ncbi:hypothetical protein RCL_jg18909.t1 [Rhizophagus clarus]|uniref:Uncharacterized protein n=1 Tax=Rhizophagus clarus TaxID=94130 RepID=A0A8H3R264_9GLOM|nr:hypothetical protein RCL_jg18909.t1 [Rhizophagus clarus]
MQTCWKSNVNLFLQSYQKSDHQMTAWTAWIFKTTSWIWILRGLPGLGFQLDHEKQRDTFPDLLVLEGMDYCTNGLEIQFLEGSVDKFGVSF